MVALPEIITAVVALLAVIGEWFHWRRVDRVKRLAFGPKEAPAAWAKLAPLFRVLALAAACWGFSSLYFVVEAQVHNKDGIPENEMKHLVLVVDVSPSMHLRDAGPEGITSRRQRASDLLESLFGRVPMRQFKISLIAVYSDAKPLLKDSTDHEVVRTIIEEMPVLHAFKPGKTKLMEGIKLTANMVKRWNPQSTHVVILTDGDTVADKGMPQMPVSVRDVVVVGLGDHKSGKFIDGHHSRQDTGTLRQIANRLRGTYHDGNKKHLPTKIANRFFDPVGEAGVAAWNRREWALFACVAGSFVFAMLPILLHYFGTFFVAGSRKPVVAT
jgi:Ca-activated chloride channel family protein